MKILNRLRKLFFKIMKFIIKNEINRKKPFKDHLKFIIFRRNLAKFNKVILLRHAKILI